MRVAIVGATGLIGRALDASLRGDDHHVVAVVRRPDDESVHNRTPYVWDAQSPLPADAVAGCDAVVNLAGASISQRWTRRAKDEIFESRVRVTEHVADAVAEAAVPVLVNGSAVGYYGAGEQPVTERAAHGTGFLADVCVAWERAAMRAEGAGVRVVRIRTGIVLAREGGALPTLTRVARLGLSGPIGGGRQWFPWIHIADHIAAVRHVIEGPEIAGPVNLVAPAVVRQREFARVLGRVLRRPAVLPAPRVLVRALLGEVASTVTTGQHAVPDVLRSTGFTFRFPEVEGALRDLLGTA